MLYSGVGIDATGKVYSSDILYNTGVCYGVSKLKLNERNQWSNRFGCHFGINFTISPNSFLSGYMTEANNLYFIHFKISGFL